MSARPNAPIAALDIGSSKIACFVAKPDDDGKMKVSGVGHKLSRGIRAGVVVDMESAIESICVTVIEAEAMAELQGKIKDVYVAYSGGPFVSETASASLRLDGSEIREPDLVRLHHDVCAPALATEREWLHAIPLGYALDGTPNIRDPRGMFGVDLSTRVHMVGAYPAPLRNLALTVERCPLTIRRMVAAPYAAGLSTLVDDEFDLGCIVIDFGGGATGIAAFLDGHLIHVDSVSIGAGHITSDIARGLTTTAAHAERLKTYFGGVIAGPSDDREGVEVPQVGECERTAASVVPRSALIGIIRPRVEEILELVRDRIEAAGLARAVGRRIVLTGGGAQLAGLREVASRLLDKQARVGRPIRIRNLSETAGGPAFAACAGLLAFAAEHAREAIDLSAREEPTKRSRLARMGRWLRDNF
ncbi:MAG: cell division protein FtsA [Alphaproteobacteria bacterium]|nr:cell division protein FtsA [Alphaproteobacteria bacterium]